MKEKLNQEKKKKKKKKKPSLWVVGKVNEE